MCIVQWCSALRLVVVCTRRRERQQKISYHSPTMTDHAHYISCVESTHTDMDHDHPPVRWEVDSCEGRQTVV